jgi:protein arginine N-methyltransferase 6
MLRDQPRMDAYRDAIMRNAEAIRGKTVLDVGCGTGILSMIAAKAGAMRVFAVEASGMAAHATKLVEHNGLSQTVTVVHGRIEDVELPDKVDVIISEWMGFYLLHESMLNSVLYARDHWLKEGGLVLPSHATLYACPVSMDQYRKEKEEFWSDVCGLDLSPFGEAVAATATAPVVQCIDDAQLLAQPATVADVDCSSVTPQQLVSIRKQLSFHVCKAGRLAGIALWFDCRFEVRSSTGAASSSPPSSSRKRPRQDSSNCQGSAHEHEHHAATASKEAPETDVVLSTAPGRAPTHWMQTIVLLGVYAEVAVGDCVAVSVAVDQDPHNPRVYSISIRT